MNTKRDVLMVIVALAAGLVGGVVSSWFLMGAPVFAQKAPQPEKVLQAERFEVVDQAGKLRAALGTASDGSPSLTLADQAGKSRATLGIASDGSPGLQLYDQAGQLRAALGWTQLEAIGTGETVNRAVSSLVLSDKNGKVIWQAP